MAYCWPWPICSKPFTFEIRLPKSGYALGESIPIDLRISNIKLVRIKFVQIYLHQRIYYPQEDTVFRYEDHIISSKRIINIPDKESELFFDQFLIVPSVPPSTNSQKNSSCKISYKFKVKVVVPGPKFCPTVHVPITILESPIAAIQDLPTYEEIEDIDLPSYDDAVILCKT